MKYRHIVWCGTLYCLTPRMWKAFVSAKLEEDAVTPESFGVAIAGDVVDVTDWETPGYVAELRRLKAAEKTS